MPPIAVLVALADPTRCRIIEILHAGPQPVHVLAGSFKISRPAISRHLRVLKQAKLISEKKSGRENLYALHAGKLKPVGDWVAAMREGRVTDKPAQKPLPTLAPANNTVLTISAPEVLLPPSSPVPLAEMVATSAKSRRDVPVSQMGFDF